MIQLLQRLLHSAPKRISFVIYYYNPAERIETAHSIIPAPVLSEIYSATDSEHAVAMHRSDCPGSVILNIVYWS